MIPMQINSDVLKKIEFLVGSEEYLSSSDKTSCRRIFDDNVVYNFPYTGCF